MSQPFNLGATKTSLPLGDIYNALGNIGSAVIQGVSSAHAAKKAYKYSKKLMAYQYTLNQRSLQESPGNRRKGLVNAGYNPMLDFLNQAYPSVGIGNQGAVSPDLGNTITNSRMANIAKHQATAQIENTNANTAKQIAEAQTEVEKPALLRSQVVGQELSNILTQKDVSWRDKEKQAEIYLKYATGSSSITNAKAAETRAEVEKDVTSFDKQRYIRWMKHHPHQESFNYGLGQWTGSVGNVFSGSAGVSRVSKR